MSNKSRRDFWIRKGRNNFKYETFDTDTPGSIVRSLSRGCQFYDAVVESPIEGGLHVIEYSAYQKAQEQVAMLKEALENISKLPMENDSARFGTVVSCEALVIAFDTLAKLKETEK